MTLVPPPRLFAARNGFALAVSAVALIGAFKAIAADTADPDSFWHLRVADQLLRDGIGPLVDSLSYRSAKTPWTPYSWLGELLMRGVWQTGGYRLAIVVSAFLSAAITALTALSCLRASGRYGVSALLSVFVAFFSFAYLSFRPVTFSLAMLALCAWLIERERAARGKSIWLVPLIVAVMANIHMTAVFVPLVLTARVAGERTRRAAFFAGASWVALCCTPMLRGMVAAAWHYQSADALVASGAIAEMRPFYAGSTGAVMAVIAMGLIGLIIHRRARLDSGDGLTAVLACGALLRWGRFAPVFAILMAPIVARAFAGRSDELIARGKIRFACVALVLVEVIACVNHFPHSSMTFEEWLNRNGPDAPGYPTAAAAFVKTHVPPVTGRLVNEFSWGGYLAWRLPEFQVFSDGRTQLYSSDFWKTAWLGDAAHKRAAVRALPADAAIVPVRRSAYFEVLREDGWTVAFEDDRARVLVPPE